MDEPEHHAFGKYEYFRSEMQSLGFDTVSQRHRLFQSYWRIIGCQGLSAEMLKQGVMAGTIVFPMVARDKARVRTQMSGTQ